MLLEHRQRLTNAIKFIKKHRVKLFFAIAFLPFLYYILFRPYLMGFDSYHYASLACGKDVPRGEAPLIPLLFSFMPCNVLLWKLLLFACMIVSLYFLNKTEENSIFFIFLMPVFLYEFFRFENEAFAFPFLFAAVFFFYRSFEKDLLKNKVLSILCTLAGCGFWGGSAFLPFILAFKKKAWAMRGLALLFFVVFGVQMWTWFFDFFFKQAFFNENILTLSFLYLLPGGFIAMQGASWKFREFWVAFFLSVLKPKLVVFSMIFFPIGIGQFVKKYPRTYTPLIFASIALLFLGPVHLQTQKPAVEVHSAVGYALDLAENREISNDWDLGYVVKFHSGHPRQSIQEMNYDFSGITVSRKSLDQNGCSFLKEFGKFSVFDCGQGIEKN